MSIDATQAKKLKDSGMTWEEVGEALEVTGTAARSAVYRARTAGPAKESVDLRKRISDLEKTLDILGGKLAKSRRPRVQIEHRAPSSPSGSFIRVMVPDVHGCFHDSPALSAFLYDLKSLSPREVVIMGDILDCGGFLAEHHTWGYVAEADYCYEDDISAANAVLDEIQKAAPNAKIYFLEGNHERRVETWCLTALTRSKKSGKNSYKDVKRLTDALAPESVLHLEERGIEYFKQGRFYHDLNIRATIKLGDCHFTHGSRAGQNAAAATLRDFGAPVVFAHTHQIQQASGNNVSSGTMAAWNVGCLCDLQPLYGHDRKTNWNHGYGVQFVNPSGNFAHVTAHIIKGESMLIPLTQMVA